jgi:glutathione synthase/RimK-type ligase-like ATP-grasp enzyme
MKIGIIQNSNNKIIPFAKKYIDILEYNNIPYKLFNINDINLFNEIKNLDFLIYAFPHTHTEKKWGKNIIYLIEKEIGIPCFPNYNEIWHYDEKLIQTILFQSHDLPFIPTRVFFDKKAADDWLINTEYPLVFKLSSGAGSGAVSLIKSYAEAKKITKRIFTKGINQKDVPGSNTEESMLRRWKYNMEQWIRSNYHSSYGREYEKYYEKQVGYAIFQQFLPDNHFDTRVNIIGDRAFAFRRMNRPNDFRASGSGRIDYDINKINHECINIAFAISDKLGFRNMAYDFIVDVNKKPLVCEITYIYSSEAVYKCPGFWDKNMKWHDGHHWPQYFHLVDLIGSYPLKQPEPDSH